MKYLNLTIKKGDFFYLIGKTGSGKSSLMKAVGLNVIMAQSGFFVSAKKFKYKPFKNIFTRINLR